MIQRRPFERTKLDEEKAEETRKNLSVSINEFERRNLDEIKLMLGTDEDGPALKAAAWAGKNVLQLLFSGKSLKAFIRGDQEK